jgi:hypothetical protein
MSSVMNSRLRSYQRFIDRNAHIYDLIVPLKKTFLLRPWELFSRQQRSPCWCERRGVDRWNIMTYLLLSNISHECIDFITLFDQPGKDARRICWVIKSRCYRRPVILTQASRVSKQHTTGICRHFFGYWWDDIDVDWIKFGSAPPAL